MFTFAINEAAVQWLGWPTSSMPAAAALLGVWGSLVALAQTSLTSEYTSSEDRAYAVAFGFVGFCGAMAVQLLPTRFVAWDLEAASAGFGALLTALAKRNRSIAEWPVELSLPPWALQLALSAAAGCISMLLFAPCLRFARGYWLESNPPKWAGDYITSSPPQRALFHLQILLPLVAALAWVS